MLDALLRSHSLYSLDVLLGHIYWYGPCQIQHSRDDDAFRTIITHPGSAD